MQSSIKVLALAALSLGMFSCAKEETVSARDKEDKIIEAYVKVNGITTKPTESGLYLDIVKEGVGEKPAITDWVIVNYTGQTLNNNFFQTSDSTVLGNLDINAKYYHLVPDFLYLAGSMPQGLREALLALKEGGKANLLIPSYIGFGQYGAVQFGQTPILPITTVAPNSPVKYQVELVKVVKEPSKYDSLMVDSFVKSNKGYTQLEGKNIYIKEIKKGSTNAADTIGNGTTVKIHYAGFFLDKDAKGNFKQMPYCFDTNIDSVAAPYYPYKPNYSLNNGQLVKNDTLSVTLSATSRTTVEGMDLALRKLKAGSIAEIVFTSTYGYEVSGRSGDATKPTIAPYTPLRFLVIIDKVVNPSDSTKKAAMAAAPAGRAPFYSLRKN